MPLILVNHSLAPFTTLKAGGPADEFCVCRTSEELAVIAMRQHKLGEDFRVIGWGSNLLPADKGVAGMTMLNLTSNIEYSESGEVIVDSGVGFQDLFLATIQRGFHGFEYAVGIPGTVGGALVSNAGAYRANISEFLTKIEICEGNERKWVDPSWMNFEYRDSKLRQVGCPPAAILRASFNLPNGKKKPMYDEARDYQRQRIGKQPAPASAGSFFKNVYDQKLADSLGNLPERLKTGGVVPAGYLLENVGMKGYRHGGAMLSARHANFMLNVGGATATEIRELAFIAFEKVIERYDVALEEEILYIGRWQNKK